MADQKNRRRVWQSDRFARLLGAKLSADQMCFTPRRRKGKVMKFANLAFAALVVLFGSWGTAASASTFNVVGGFSGGQLGEIAFDFNITNDFSASITPSTSAGLVVNSLTSSAVSGDPFPIAAGFSIQYRYDFPVDRLVLGTAFSNVIQTSSAFTTFDVAIINFTTAPSISSSAATSAR